MEQGFDLSYMVEVIPKLMKAFPLTIKLAFISLAFGFLLGLVLVIFRLRKGKVLRGLAGAYIRVIRSTPTIVLLFLLFYGLPVLLSLVGLDISGWDKVSFGIICYTMFSGAYFSETMRAAYESVPKGQYEAGVSVGLSEFQALARIVIPQAFAVALPNFGNTIIQILKDTSVIFTLGVVDLLGQAKLISTNGYGIKKIEVFIAVSLIYWVISLVIEKLSDFLEKHYTKNRAAT